MSARVTMRDVARAAGVSPMTVSRALKQDGFVNAETRARVREAADRLGYVYDTTAQAFRAQRSGFLAVTMPSINNANFAATHRALAGTLADAGLQILLGITDYRVEEEERLVRQLLARRPEAIVMTGGMHSETTRSVVSALAIPVIEIWDLPPDPIGHVVGFSNADAMGLAVRHLAERGRRRLAFVGATGESDHRGAERYRGAQAEALALGLGEVGFLDIGPAPATMSAAAQAVTEAGAALSDYDALVCVSDPVAFGALQACRALGVDVPGALAITGFGAFEIASVNRPAITTIDVSAARIGSETGRLAAALLAKNAEPMAPQRIDTGAVLVPGETS